MVTLTHQGLRARNLAQRFHSDAYFTQNSGQLNRTVQDATEGISGVFAVIFHLICVAAPTGLLVGGPAARKTQP
jgi:hypothetical protein